MVGQQRKRTRKQLCCEKHVVPRGNFVGRCRINKISGVLVSKAKVAHYFLKGIRPIFWICFFSNLRKGGQLTETLVCVPLRDRVRSDTAGDKLAFTSRIFALSKDCLLSSIYSLRGLPAWPGVMKSRCSTLVQVSSNLSHTSKVYLKPE